jgi:APA family basic amino acid/polyamine antiporter
MLYRSTDRLCRCGAPVKNLAHSASLHSQDKIAPSKSGIKHLGIAFSLLLMVFLPWETWLRLIVWLAIGLVLYFAYGRSHSAIVNSGRR